MEAEESNSDRKPDGDNRPLLPEVVYVPEGEDKVFKYRLTVEPILLALFLADGLTEPVTVNLILQRTCEIHFHYNKSVCSNLGNSLHSGAQQSDLEATIQQYSAVILMGAQLLSQVFPALLSLFIGPWSDYNGRKLVLVIPSLGYFFKYILLLTLCFFPNLGPEFVFIAVIPAGFSGGMVNFISGAYAYASDISNEDNQSFRISVIESAIYLGNIIGVFSTSYVYKAGGDHGFLLVYGLSASIIILATIPTHIFLPESVGATEGGKGLAHIFELKLLKEMFQVCFKKREGYKRAVIFLVIASLTITVSALLGEANLLFLFAKHRFGWDIKRFTHWAFISLGTGFLGVVCGTVILIKWLKISDATLGFISYVMKAASSFYVAFIPSKSPNMMYYSGLISIFGGLCGAAGRSILSKSVSKEDLGKIFALTGTIETTAPLAVAPLYTLLYTKTIKKLPSAFFILSGSLFVLCAVFFIMIYFANKKTPQPVYERMENENVSS